ncbi:Hypothetical protein LUCI_1877 [Lucifera butyrica]|uniref:Uncharacterized protein n=1 Tax=Lucifera butyrica TaxID=1351585 RepID=A0A498R5H4_9FIRM|nr:hypothetical protein [Lucifera butyrica]VBB06641.1 Hypothetical protein LUCI_1877 [Lucifera butyrica]
MGKIKKNLTDQEMLAGYQEKITFEHMPDEEVPAKQDKSSKKPSADHFANAFLSPELEEKIGKLLLELKLKLFKEGIVDYEIKPVLDGTQIVLRAVPKPAKEKGKSGNPR